MTQWDAGQYLRFATERTQPAIDLARRLPADAPREVLDVGCGPGNSTQVLAARFPQARIRGIDRSPEMIAAARQHAPELTFDIGDAATDLPRLADRFDVVFSNACIQWIPDHPALLTRLLGLLRPGGVLAVQTPMNDDEPIQRIILELVTSPPWAPYFPQPRIFHNLTPGRYFDLLRAQADQVTLWNTTYYHVLGSHADIMEWYRGTGLRPYLGALPEPEKQAFEDAVYRQIVARYPVQADGAVLFRFPRFFFMATARTGNAA